MANTGASLFILLLFILGIFSIITYVSKISCPPSRVEYRFLPRSFEEQQIGPAPVSDVFSNMFAKEAPLESYEGGGKDVQFGNNQWNKYSYSV